MSKELSIIENTVNEAAGQFVSTLSQYQWNLIPDTQLQAAKQALTKNDYIMKTAAADPGAVHDALINSAVLGLDLTEGKRQGWLIPRKNQRGKTVITLQVGYKGVEAIHQRMGVIDRLVVRVVRENDTFEWSGDDQEKPKHEADWFLTDEQRGAIKGAFAITYYPDKSINVVVTSISEIYEKHRDRADSYRTYIRKLDAGEKACPPPWVSDEKAMVEKTMAYIAAKQWPANIRDEDRSSKILETLHTIDVSDYSRYTPEQKDAFYRFFEADDSLGMWLFSQRVDIETFAALFNTFPKGEKVKKKEIVRRMEGEGVKMFHTILEGLDENDPAKVKENIDGCLDVTVKMVLPKLNDTQKEIFKHLLQEEAA